jgi:hypothetical protein
MYLNSAVDDVTNKPARRRRNANGCNGRTLIVGDHTAYARCGHGVPAAGLRLPVPAGQRLLASRRLPGSRKERLSLLAESAYYIHTHCLR